MKRFGNVILEFVAVALTFDITICDAEAARFCGEPAGIQQLS